MYYLHVNVPEDELIQDAFDAEEVQLAQSELHIPETVLEEDTKVINRKPLPSKPASALGNRLQPPSNVFLASQPSLDNSGLNRATSRKPVKAITQQPTEVYENSPPLPRRPFEEVPPAPPARRNADTSMPPSPRRLQGPRPLHSQNESVDTALLSQGLKKENVNPRRWSEQPNTPVDRGAHPLSVRDPGGEVTELDTVKSSETPLLSITLIRRDPSTGEQWNVGRIMSSPTPGVDSALSDTTKNLQEEVLVELDAPGYRDLSKSRSFGNNHAPDETRSFESNTFRRSLYVGKSRAVVKTPSPRRSEFDFSATRAKNRPSLGSSRSYSQTNYPHCESNLPLPQNYSFLSPWQGQCTFSTSATGKSIKCSHILPSGLRQRPNNASFDLTGLLVSELRFNLPSSNVFKLRTQDHKRPSLGKFSRSTGSNSHPRLLPRSHRGLKASQSLVDHDSSSEEDKMDLSLGQERAGGGFGGKKAKLGKLILEYEGLKMLDLLVAVNMAIWWKVYE